MNFHEFKHSIPNLGIPGGTAFTSLQECLHSFPVSGIQDITGFRGVQIFKEGSVMFCNFTAYHLQKGVELVVFLGEGFAQDANGRRKPALRKHILVFSSHTVLLYLLHNLLKRFCNAFC